jgi:hypothetical protein
MASLDDIVNATVLMIVRHVPRTVRYAKHVYLTTAMGINVPAKEINVTNIVRFFIV